jgi:hypothetical protein
VTDEERVAIMDLADELQVRKQRIFKLLPRLGIHPILRREPDRGNQNVATVTVAESSSIRREIQGGPVDGAAPFLASSDDVGFFYLIQLEPQHDAGRFKVGFTVELDGRLQKHRCSAPFATYIRTWPCRRTWERAAIDCSTLGCEQLHTEVFRTHELSTVLDRADRFFAVMPSLLAGPEPGDEAEVAESSEKPTD